MSVIPPSVWALSETDLAHLGLARAFWQRGLRFRSALIEPGQEEREYECIALRDGVAYVRRSPEDYLAQAIDSLVAAGVDVGVLRRVEVLVRDDVARRRALSAGARTPTNTQENTRKPA